MRSVGLGVVLIGAVALGCTLAPFASRSLAGVEIASPTPDPAAEPSPTLVSSPTPTGTATASPDVVTDLLARTNKLRSALGLPSITLNSALMSAAQNQAEWMVSTGIVAHQRPDGSTPALRAQAAG